MLIRTTRNYGIQSLKMLVFGPAGVGKTTLAATTNEPTLVVSVEGGLLSLSDHDVDFIDCTVDDTGRVLNKSDRMQKLLEVYNWLQTDDARSKYRWVVLDSLTEIGQNIVEKQNTLFPERKDGMVMWGEVAKELRQLVKAWRDIPGYNVLFTALSETDKDEFGARFQGVSLPGKIAQQIAAFFDEVFFYHTYQTEEGETKRVLITQPSEKVIAKDRSGKLDQLMEPHLGKIASRIRGGSTDTPKTKTQTKLSTNTKTERELSL